MHPDEVLKYIDAKECELSYNPLLMALIWNTLATRETALLMQSMRKSFAISPDCAWVNYVRCHDDIGWTFDDDVAAQLGIDGNQHRRFLNQFYTGRFEGSFATGVAFGENPSNGDCRVCGSLASLAGLEQAIQRNDHLLIDNAIKRILLVHSIILSIGGVPLLYSGDELGLLNDYSYEQDPSKAHDQRWVQRIPIKHDDIEVAHQPGTAQYKIANGLQHLITTRQQHPVFGHAQTQILDTFNGHTFAYLRSNAKGEKMLAVVNFSEHPQAIDSRIIDALGGNQATDLLTHNRYTITQNPLELGTYQTLWLSAG